MTPGRRTVLRAAALAGLGLLTTSCAGGGAGAGQGPQGDDGIVGTAAEARVDVERAALDTSRLPAAGEAVAGFAGALLGQVAHEVPTANLVLSPWSVIAALAMNRAGAAGRTLDQINRAIGGPALGRPRELDGLLNAASLTLESRNRTVLVDGEEHPVALRSANSVWGARDIVWERPFLDTLARHHGSGVRLTDFMGDPEAARRAINAWVADHTEDHITELVPEGTIKPITAMALVNAVWFTAPWAAPFAPEVTRPGDFTRADGTRVKAQLMSGHLDPASLVEADAYQAVRLPFAGDELAMTAVLPRPGREADVATSFAGRGLSEVLGARGEPGVEVTMPRFSFRSAIDLAPVLQGLGIVDAFDRSRADYSAMTRQERLFISAALHQATIAVDESGAEASAATAIVMGRMSAVVEQQTITLDRPFWVVIHDIESRIPLFVGHVADPTAA